MLRRGTDRSSGLAGVHSTARATAARAWEEVPCCKGVAAWAASVAAEAAAAAASN